jgi:NADH-quinone oxidoreductase subunit N
MAGMAMLIVGLAFKVSAAPFHMWAPDVYQGAPGGVTGFLAAGAKVAGFAAMARVLTVALGARIDDWAPAIGVLAVSIVAGRPRHHQSDLAMLAYSSVAHGFILGPGCRGARVPACGSAWRRTVRVLAAFTVAAVVSGPAQGRAPLSDYAIWLPVAGARRHARAPHAGDGRYSAHRRLVGKAAVFVRRSMPTTCGW